MSAEALTQKLTKARYQSKRTNLLIWLLVFWSFIYLLSCLGGTGISPMFAAVAEIFGLIPISILLLFAAFTGNQLFQRVLSWMALLIFLASFALLIVLDTQHVAQDTAVLITRGTHWAITVFSFMGLLIRTVICKGSTK
jgi:hypothetical protein